MPTYEYACQKCGHQFELFQSMKADTLKVCPKDLCPKKTWGKGKVTKLMGAGAGLIFKGSGFYITDYRSQNYKDAAKKDSSASSSSGSSSTSSSSPSSGGGTASSPSPAKSDSKPSSSGGTSTKPKGKSSKG
ncbi:MAG TPA: FmdB family transcriptional regulator [Verrucomicrobiales bacterium]|nr:FmdB family transcriptional regulator [Verrucomicrobiales bacterium]